MIHEIDNEQAKRHRLDERSDRRCIQRAGNETSLLTLADDVGKLVGNRGLEPSQRLSKIGVRRTRAHDTGTHYPNGVPRRLADRQREQFDDGDEVGRRPSRPNRSAKGVDVAQRLLSEPVELSSAHERVAILKVVINGTTGETGRMRNALDRHGCLALVHDEGDGRVDQTPDCLSRPVLGRALSIVAVMCERFPTVDVDALGHARQFSVASAALNVTLGRITAVVFAASGA